MFQDVVAFRAGLGDRRNARTSRAVEADRPDLAILDFVFFIDDQDELLALVRADGPVVDE